MPRKSIYKMKTTREEKVVTTVYIPRDLYEKVVELAPRVYGIVRGAFSKAVEEGLRLWLAHRAGHTQLHTNPRLPLRERYNAWIRCIEEELGSVPITLPQIVAEACIMRAFNVKDQRTVYGWLHRFYLAGLIKPLTIKVEKPNEWRYNKAIEIVAREV